jgi:hypothetical protein
MTDDQERFAAIQSEYADDPRVTMGTGFGPKLGMRVDGRIFAMLVHGGIALKLPRDRVQTLVDTGAGRQFGMGKKRPMKEWVSIAVDASDARVLVAEAYAFAGGTELGA